MSRLPTPFPPLEHARVDRDQSDRGTIAQLNEFIYRPLQRKLASLRGQAQECDGPTVARLFRPTAFFSRYLLRIASQSPACTRTGHANCI